MKKITLLIAGVFLLMSSAFAGGILTNTNQSAQFARMLSRNASTDLDAVYFNPAGLTQLENGFYFGLHNQSITQNRTINSGFSLLNNHDYKGDVSAPVFPDAYAVYKLNNWAFSAGFGPNGGGGSAKYNTGLPSFEKDIAKLVPALSGLSALGYPVAAYSVNIAFEGQSVFWGIQAGATYKVNDMISVYGGARYLPSINTYTGSITNIQVGPAGALQKAETYLKAAAGVANAKSQQLTAAATSLQPAINGGAGGMTLAQLEAAKMMAPAQRAQLEGGLANIGVPAAQIPLMNVNQIQSAYNAGSAKLVGTAAGLIANAAKLLDKSVDTKQTGAGFTPILGVDIKLDKLNIGLKYEFQTTLKLTNSTKVDDTGLFPNGDKTRSDLPAILAGGADYQITNKLKASGSFDIYFDKNVNWGKNVYFQDRTIDKNYVELALGLEYKLTNTLALSAGYLNSNTGVSEQYQSDFSYSNDSYTYGGGLQYKVGKKMVLDAGLMYTTYKNATKSFTDATFGNYKETYGKDTFTLAFGIGYKIF